MSKFFWLLILTAAATPAQAQDQKSANLPAACDILACSLDKEGKPGDKSYDAGLKVLEENFALHADVEERDPFPQLERRFPLSRLELTMKLESARVRDRHSGAD